MSDSSQPSVTPVPEDLTLASGLRGHCTHLSAHTYIHTYTSLKMIICFETGFLCIILTVLELTLYNRLVSTQKSTCLCLQSAGIKGVRLHHPAWFVRILLSILASMFIREIGLKFSFFVGSFMWFRYQSNCGFIE